MNIQKLPSGNYRIRQMVNGKSYSVTLDHRPTQIEAAKIVSDLTVNVPRKGEYTVIGACRAYITAKNNVLSPSTIPGYESIMRQLSDSFAKCPISQVTTAMFQTEVNNYAIGRKPKTIKNFYIFLSSVFKFYGCNIKSPTIPQAVISPIVLPSIEDMARIIKEVEGTPYEIFFRIAMYGLRRSEILALTINDLDGTTLTINKAMVINSDKKMVIKTTKTTDSTRTIEIDEDLANKIRAQGYIWKGSPGAPYKKLIQIQKRLDMPRFKLHSLRHLLVSELHNDGWSDKQIQNVGGWKTSSVMDRVYKHAIGMDEAKKSLANKMGAYFS